MSAIAVHLLFRSNQAHIKDRRLGVSFEGLRVVGLGSASSYQETLGTLLNPSYLGERVRNARNPFLRNIISGFEGVVRPGDMLRSYFYNIPKACLTAL